MAFRLDPVDEYPHTPGAARNFNESVYGNAFDETGRYGGWMRLGNRVNEGHAELSVCLYLPEGRIACQFQRPDIAGNERFSAGGLDIQVVEPFRRLAMRYTGDLMLLDDPALLRTPKRLFAEAPRVPGEVHWDLVADSPMHGGEPTSATQQTYYGRDFSLGHFNQHVRVTGHLQVGAERWPLAGGGWRDHSWGPRYWQSIYCYRLFIANFGPGRGFMLLKITDAAGYSRRLGVLLVDGEYEEVLDLDLTTEWSPAADPVRVHLGVRTAHRREQIDGDVLVMAPLRNRRQAGETLLESRIAEGYTRFHWAGRTGYGMTEYIERLVDDRPVGVPL